MFHKISVFLYQVSRTWVMLLSLALMILMMVIVLPAQAEIADASTGGADSPDTTFFYRPAQLSEWAAAYGEGGRQAYIRARWTFDLLFPLVYASFLAAGISWFASRIPNLPDPFKTANLLPIGGGLLDYLENSSTSLLMALYPTQIPGLAAAAAAISAIKWFLVWLSFLAYFVLMFVFIYNKIRKVRR